MVWAHIRRVYIRDVNWVTYLGGVSLRGLYTGVALTGFSGISMYYFYVIFVM